jgi:CPA2 family monovalent cation:H+ antiporter-2
MAESLLIIDMALLITVATVFAYFARLLRQPFIVAYVLAGIIIGPLGFGLITNIEEMNVLAEIGIAFLLFAIGLEIDFRKLRSVGTAAIIGGTIQVGLTFVLGFVLSLMFSFGLIVSVYMGLLVSFSSTMVVAKILVDRMQINTLHGRIMLGILILQDLIVIAVLPILADMSIMLSWEMFAPMLVKGLGLFSIAIVLNRFVFRKVLDYAAKNHELLFLTAVAVCFIFIGLAYVLGFSIAIGAFIGGIALAQFPYNLEIFGEMHSLRDFFSVIFFTSLGMQLSLSVISSMIIPFLIFLVVIVILKPLILSVTYILLGYGGRNATIIGIGLGQASEFSFIIAAQGLMLGHLDGGTYSLIISLVVLSMVITPYTMRFRHEIHSFFSDRKIRLPESLSTPTHVSKIEKKPKKGIRNHVVVFGCDVMGNKVIDYLKSKRARFMVIEQNPEIIRKLSKEGVYTMYGDAFNEDMLKETGLYKAKLAVITIPNVEVSGFIVGKAKRFNPSIKIYARAHSEDDANALYRAGADFVVVPDFVSGGTLVRKLDHFISSKKNRTMLRHLR